MAPTAMRGSPADVGAPGISWKRSPIEGCEVEYKLTHDEPVTEEEALALAAEMGLHGLAFTVKTQEDEELHWHEFSAVTWVISGTGALMNQEGERIEVGPGCRLDAPAGYLHRGLAGEPYRVVIGTDLPFEAWTKPVDKPPSELPAELAS